MVDRGRTPPGLPPTELTAYEKQLYWAWLGEHYSAWQTPRRARELVETCFDFWTNHPEPKKRTKQDWLAACRTWARNEERYHGYTPPKLGYSAPVRLRVVS